MKRCTPFLSASLIFFLTIGWHFSRAQNPIQLENNLPGNPASEWDISGAGDPDIQGFSTDISINTGGTIDFKIDIKPPATNYGIKIYRLGYYGGDGARLIEDLGTGFTGLAQAAPLYEVATGKTDCSNWSISTSWTATNAVSGIYLAKLTRNDDGGSSHIAFVVRDDARNAELLFKTSDATWQAYNGYGGNSLYVNNSGTAVPGFNHATKVSYDRPFYTRAGGGGSSSSEDWLFNAEYPMIRWLERNGYDVSYTTDVDMDRDPTVITPAIHKVLLSVGHDEYWSAAERSKFETARNNGVHLAFFSGNEVYWKTRWEDNHRTLVCYKEGTLGENVCNGDCDPDPNVWTGLWRDGCSSTDSNDGCKPENTLTGQISWGDATGSIVVPDTYSGFRFWRNTSIAALTGGQSATLPNGTLGYEFDFEQYFDFYPAGRVTLSNTLLAGKNHKLSLYLHSSGALVFGAGTVQWSWGLDAEHDRGSEPASSDMQQATVNLFADMGVAAATLQNDLVPPTASADLNPAVSIITSPADGATLTNGATVTITGTASDAEGVVAGVEVSVDGGTTWQIADGAAAWTFNWTPTVNGPVTIQSRAFDDLGNLEVPASGQPNTISATVETGTIACPCTIWNPSTVPATITEADVNAVELGLRFRSSEDGFITGIRFYKGPANTGTHTGNLWTNTGTNLATAVFSSETASGWQEVSFATPVAVTANTTYIASYHTLVGNYSVDANFFTTAGVDNPPLRALADGEDGANGVYVYSATSAFPTQTFEASNYWVDVVFETETGPDETPPLVADNTPLNGAIGISISTTITATFNEPMDPATLTTATFELLDGGNPVTAAVSYDAGSRTATLTPAADLDPETAYTARIAGGTTDPRVKDSAGNALASDFTWTFTTAGPPPSEGPGGPILIISAAANPFSRYPVEILRAQGFNEFTAEDISQVTPALLNNYDVILLGDIPLSTGNVTDLTAWVSAGGTLIAFRPDPQLATLLGLTPAGGTLAEGYLLVNTASGPGAGIVGATIQFHGTADLYTLNGAASLATLYTDATTATTNPAVTTIDVGPNGGKAVAFTYDLARSVVYTRQGNPAWAGQNRDVNVVGSDAVIRSNDLFFGNAPGDPQPDWVDLNKVAIPDADEQLHLLSNIIELSNLHRKPLPRFWFLPNNFKAAVVMTGDDHAVGLTNQFFDQFLALSPSNTAQAVMDWVAVRGSSYLYPGTVSQFTNAAALGYQNQGFEVGIHINTGCDVWTPSSIAADYTADLAAFGANYPDILPPTTHRTHCIAWSDYDTQPQVEVANGIRLDVNYYYWPAAWIQDRPGMFTGSGLPMRFAQTDGTIIDCYQVPTQMTDESGQTITTHIATLLDNALGANGYYGVFCANMHTDRPGSIALATDIINAALTRGVPVVSSRQMLEWLDGRNASSFDNIAWNGNDLSFEVSAGAGANNLYGMVPVNADNGQLLSLLVDGSPINYTIETIKGIDYAIYPAGSGAYVASYGLDNIAPVISNVQAVTNENGTATVTWDTDEPANSVVNYAPSGDPLSPEVSSAALVTSHSLIISNLSLGLTYDFRVSSTDAASNSAEFPASPAVLSFTMPSPPCGEDMVTADFALGSTDANTLIVSEGDGAVILQPTLYEAFSGASTPSGWTEAIWNGQAGAGTTYNGDLVTVDGTHIYTQSTFGPGTSVEFSATFTAGNFQNIGFTNNAEFDDIWVVIGRGSIGDNNLYARTSDNQSVVLGANLLGAPHKYRISWNAGTDDFSFYVDDLLIATTAIVLTVPATTPMIVQISDFPAGGVGLTADWIRIGGYPNSGSFTSRVFDQGSPSGWGICNWNETVPAGTSLAISVRAGNTPTPDGSWSAFAPLSNGTSVGLTSQYLQYKADLSTVNTTLSPVLQDIVFECDATPDGTPPVITNIIATSAADGLSATITWDTDEPASSQVDYGTDANNLSGTESSGSLVTSHSLVLTGLIPSTEYFFRVSSTDLAANSATEPDLVSAPLSFTTSTPPCFVDQSASEFELGAFTGTYLATAEDGVILSPTLGSEFTGLPSTTAWDGFSWDLTPGTYTATAGILTVDGARYNTQPASTTYGPGRSLEFVATFGAASFQHVGFGGGSDATTSGGIYTGQDPFVMFSTGNTTTTLKTRTSVNGSTVVEFDLPGNYLGSAHRYRIDWKPDGTFEFFVDGTSVRVEPTAITAEMRPAISDFAPGGPSIAVDWIRMTPYLSTGTFESRVYDAGTLKDWGPVTWVADQPAGTTLAIAVRTGNVLPLTGPYFNIASSGDLVGASSRYIQYQAELTTSDVSLTPVLQEVAIACEDAPATGPAITLQPSSQTVCAGTTVTFESAAGGNPIPTVQWQESTDNGGSWSDIAAATDPEYTFTAAAADDGKQFRAVWTNSEGSAESDAATLSVNPLPTATISAVDNPICPGDLVELELLNTSGTAPFGVVVNGTNYSAVTPGQVFAGIDPSEGSSIWSPATVGGTQTVDNTPTELGLQFNASVSGFISGIRFYKPGTDILNFTVSLWSVGNTTTPLATANYTSDAVPGWKQVNFAAPVAVNAGTSYIASYFSPGPNYYAFTANGLATPVVNPPLTAEAAFFKQPGPGYPDVSSTANYWVDVAFLENDPNLPLTYDLTTIIDDKGCSNTGSPLSSVTVTTNPAPAGTLAAVSAPVCEGSSIDLTYNATAGTGPFDLLINGSLYENIADGTPFSVGDAPPFMRSTANIWSNSSPTSPPIEDSPVVLGVKFRSATAGLISGIRFYKGWNNTGTETYMVRLWTNGAPGVVLAEASAVLGDNDMGWQQIDFSGPVAIAANTTYIASFLTPSGRYMATGGAFNTSYNETGSPLTAIASGDVDGPNGVFAYTTPPAFPFPTNTFNAANYWIDVDFRTDPDALEYELTSIEDDNGCITTESSPAAVDIPYVPCPCDLITAGMVLRLESDYGVEQQAAAVTGWKDQSGRGNDLSAFGDPLVTSFGGPKGQPFIQLDGTGDKLERSAPINGLPVSDEDRTIFLVARYNAVTTAAGLVYGNSGTDEAFGLTADNSTENLAVTNGTNSFVSTGGSPANGIGAGWLSQSVVLSGGTFTHFLNGEAIATGTPTLATGLSKIVLGQDIGQSGFAQLDVAAVLIYDRALSIAEREEIEAYLQNKYFGLLTDNLALHLESDLGITAVGNTVSTWADQSDQSNDLTAAGDPQLITSGGPNDRPYLELDGVGDKLERLAATGLPLGSADRTVFLVAQYTAVPNIGTTGLVYGTNNNGEAFGPVINGATGTLALAGGGTDVYDTDIAGLGAGWLIQSAVLQSGTLNQYKNGTLLDTDNPLVNTAAGATLLGENPAGNGFADMDVAAVLIYDRALTEAERLRVDAYLQHKYFGRGNSCINLSATVLLEGSFHSADGKMKDDLRIKNLIPITDPYPGLGFTHIGGNCETIRTTVLDIAGDDAIVDWVFVELRDAGDPTLVVATRSALLQRDGDIVDTNGVTPVRFPNMPPGNYYIAVRHRNHLPVMTANPIRLNKGQ